VDLVSEALSFDFFRQGLAAAALTGALCGLVGVFVVLRRMSYIGHGLSHAIFGGAAVSTVLQWNFYLGAGLWGFLAALLIQATGRRRDIGADAAIGIITTASFALGVAIISKTRSFTLNFEAALFGNILAVTGTDLLVIAGVAAVIALAVIAGYKQVLFATFDPDLARIYQVPTRWVEAGFALALAATVVACMNVVGVTLIAAAIVIPPMTARLLTASFGRMLALATLIGAIAGVAGMFTSYALDVASGPAIVLVAALLFAATYVGTGLWTAITRWTGARTVGVAKY
jgi:manganese/iron transport system permease protein/iron/zinc/copper transport system permease protein